ncbi:MAG: hypothetical protein U0841_17340 [Chloroflexia bacterium]
MFNATDELLLLGTGAARAMAIAAARFYLEWCCATTPPKCRWPRPGTGSAGSPTTRTSAAAADDGDRHQPQPSRRGATCPARWPPARRRTGRPAPAPRPARPAAPGGRGRGAALPMPRLRRRSAVRRGAPDLRCQFCGHTGAPDAGDGAVDEQDWAVAAFSQRGRRWVLPTERLLTCQNCGATEVLPPGESERNLRLLRLVTGRAGAGATQLVTPEAVAPFTFNADIARHRALQVAHPSSPCAARPPRARRARRLARSISPSGPSISRAKSPGAATLRRSGTAACSAAAPITSSTTICTSPPGQLPVELPLRDFRCDAATLAPYAADLLAGWPVELYSLPPTDASLLARERVMQQHRSNFRTDDGGEQIEKT